MARCSDRCCSRSARPSSARGCWLRASARPSRAGGSEPLLQRRGDRARPAVRAAPAGARARSAPASIWPRSGARPQSSARARRLPDPTACSGRAGRRGPRDRRCRCPRCRWRRSRAGGRSTSAWSRSPGAAGRSICSRRARSRRCSRRRRRRRSSRVTRRYPRGWWAPAAAGSVLVRRRCWRRSRRCCSTRSSTTSRRCRRARRAPTCSSCAAAAGVKVGEVYSVDASRRTTAANAYVTGLGPTKRVVLFDTLLDRYDRDEVRVVVAHELAHVRHRDVPRGVLYAAIVAPAAALAVQRLSWALSPERGTAAALPALALAAGARVRADRADRQPAVARGRAPRRRVLARADGRARGVRLVRADDRAPERRRSRPAALGLDSCWRRTRRRPSGSAPRWLRARTPAAAAPAATTHRAEAS